MFAWSARVGAETVTRLYGQWPLLNGHAELQGIYYEEILIDSYLRGVSLIWHGSLHVELPGSWLKHRHSEVTVFLFEAS